MYKIYVLIDPKNILFYVGYTKQALSERLRLHFKDAGKRNAPVHKIIRQYGKDIKIIEIERVSEKEVASLRETYWINTYISEGVSLLNVHKSPLKFKRAYVKKKRSERKAPDKIIWASFTLQELEIIRTKYRFQVSHIRKLTLLANSSIETIRAILKGERKRVRKNIYDCIREYYGIS